MAVRGALETSFSDADDETIKVWEYLTDFTFRFSGFSISVEELRQMISIQDKNRICQGPFHAESRSGKHLAVPIDLVFEAQKFMMDNKRKSSGDDTIKQIDGKEWVKIHKASDHKRKQSILSCFEDFSSMDGFSDFSVFLAACAHIGMSGKMQGRTDNDLKKIFQEFWKVQDLIFRTHDVIAFCSKE